MVSLVSGVTTLTDQVPSNDAAAVLPGVAAGDSAFRAIAEGVGVAVGVGRRPLFLEFFGLRSVLFSSSLVRHRV